MKIAFDIQSLFERQKTGIGWVVKEWVDHMIENPEADYQFNCFTFQDKKRKELVLESYKKRQICIKKCSWMPLSLYRRIWRFFPIPYRLLINGQADITQFFNYVIPPGVKGKKSVVIYDMVYKACPETMEEKDRKFLDKNLKNAFKRADFVITISEFSKNEIIKYMKYPSEKIYVVPCGIDTSVYHPYHDQKSIARIKDKYGINREYFCYLGTLEPRKNISILIMAYAEWKKRTDEPLPLLVLAGKKGWKYELIFESVRKYELENEILFLDYIKQEEKPLLLSGARAFLFPSLYEGFGIPPLEAMGCGTPVIVSNRSSLPEVIEDAGILVSPTDTSQMMVEMEKMWKDEEHYIEYRKKALQRASMFTWNQAATILMNVYRQEYSK